MAKTVYALHVAFTVVASTKQCTVTAAGSHIGLGIAEHGWRMSDPLDMPAYRIEEWCLEIQGA